VRRNGNAPLTCHDVDFARAARYDGGLVLGVCSTSGRDQPTMLAVRSLLAMAASASNAHGGLAMSRHLLGSLLGGFGSVVVAALLSGVPQPLVAVAEPVKGALS